MTGKPSTLLTARSVSILCGMQQPSAGLPAALGRPAARALEAAGYYVIADLEGASERELLALHGVGPKAIRILRENGVELAP
ncbi:hypothetical protein EDD32_2291 [Georgenia muralis]|uniref:Helix-hairpin-helix protein n=1 Tax=Georgenia muralis TaxID=154117 RepID=A0A3N5A7X1_9MICO|nr:hypothetical protein EDD32_2291 [Georgenia muralis]